MESKLQIISGRYRGRKLALPASARPTQNKARIALFNMLMGTRDWGLGTVIWDAFAGSGAFGAEFLSRTNAHVIFTDISAESFKVINKNVQSLTPSPQSRFTIEMTDALGAIKRHGPIADIIFVDPPYDKLDLAVAFVRKLTHAAKPGAILVWEMDTPPSPASPVLPPLAGGDIGTASPVLPPLAGGDIGTALPVFPPLAGGDGAWTLLKDKTYGRARFLILQKT